MAKIILIVDDEESIRVSLGGILEDEGYQIICVESGADAIDIIREEVPDLVLLDIWMPGLDGIQTLEMIRNLYADLTVIMMSGHGTIETAVKATRMGAFDFIEKPFSLDKILITVGNALNLKELRKENEVLRLSSLKEHDVIGVSSVAESLRSQIARLSNASAPVLFQGEEGVGKELVARAIHHNGARKNRPFVSVNCMAVPGELLNDELLGHERGAYTGASHQKRGRFDLADGGTLYLDEIHELPHKAQGELLRIISEHCFERCGGSRPVRIDVRIIAATSRDLLQAVREGRFREDLYHQLQVLQLKFAPLRERREDIPLLVRHFVHLFHRREGWELKDFDESALQCLQSYNWPGNIRELKNIIERVLIMIDSSAVTSGDLMEFIPSGFCCSGAVPDNHNKTGYESCISLREARGLFERDFLRQKLEACNWELDLAARQMDIERTALHRKLVQYGLSPAANKL